MAKEAWINNSNDTQELIKNRSVKLIIIRKYKTMLSTRFRLKK